MPPPWPNLFFFSTSSHPLSLFRRRRLINTSTPPGAVVVPLRHHLLQARVPRVVRRLFSLTGPRNRSLPAAPRSAQARRLLLDGVEADPRRAQVVRRRGGAGHRWGVCGRYGVKFWRGREREKEREREIANAQVLKVVYPYLLDRRGCRIHKPRPCGLRRLIIHSSCG